eukprot:scpid60382/ scgid2403/ Cyclin-related protein FAM58A
MGGAIHCFVPVCLPSCVLAGFRLELDHSAVHAAATLFHRFQAACDHGDDTQEKIDEHILCVTCLFIAVKMEEITNTRLRDIITCAYRLLRPEKSVLTDHITYTALRDRAMKLEMLVLQRLGFYVKIDTPQRYLAHQLLLFQRWLGASACSSFAFAPLAWSLLHDAVHSRRLCIGVSPERLAACCAYLAVRSLRLDVAKAPLHGMQWWKPLARDGGEEELKSLAVVLMQVYRSDTGKA